MGSHEDIGKIISVAIEREVERALNQKGFSKRIGADAIDNVEPAEGLDLSCGHYYLDEAGDMTLFDHKGRIIIGQEGCSLYCMLGLLKVKDPKRLSNEMEALRSSLLTDPYFRGIPSFDPKKRRLALYFHAKDDIPEVRREVFRLLLRSDVTFSAVVNDKHAVLDTYVRPRQAIEPDYRYNPNHQYDYNVKCLFKGRLHKMDTINIHFAHRGASDRTYALRHALETQQREMNQQWNITEASVLNISVDYSHEEVCCQAADYFLWAVQRLFEKKEDRYYNYLIEKISFINERNRHRDGHHGGTFYTRKKPLTVAALETTG